MRADDLITYQQLIDLEERLYKSIKSLLEDQEKPKKFIRTNELKKRLGGVSDSLVTKLRIKGLLPYTKLGGMYLYDWEKIEKNILSNQINEGGKK